MRKIILIFILIAISYKINAQNKLSFDFSNVKNTRIALNGINFSVFYHFNEQLSGGIELNRFFGKKIIRKDIESENKFEEIELSAWDFDYNFHYNLPISNHVITYPIIGFSHTSEKEKIITNASEHNEHFWSYNSGLGLMYSLGKISPHVEYLFTWGKINQEFLLVGFSYEFDVKKEKHSKHIIE